MRRRKNGGGGGEEEDEEEEGKKKNKKMEEEKKNKKKEEEEKEDEEKEDEKKKKNSIKLLPFPLYIYVLSSTFILMLGYNQYTHPASLAADKPPIYVNTLININKKSGSPLAKSTCKHLWYWHHETDCMPSVSCNRLSHRQSSLKNRKCNSPSDRMIGLISLKIFT
jgi:hypothetical protein